MTTIRQLIQTSPSKANELLAKLADTSENAVKTRERLFTELKAELELLASLEEEHLFPVLKKRKEMKDLVADALADNRETRKLLAELERTPKESEEFGFKAAELKKVFQQHVRDEKKEFLPAVMKALSDEEAEAIVEKIETEKAEIEEVRRAEAEERRTEARRARDQVDSLERSSENLLDAARTGMQEARQTMQAAQDTLQRQVGTVSDLAHRSTAQILQAFDDSSEQRQNLAAMSEAGNVLARGLQDISGEWFDLVRDRLLKNLDGFGALARCRSLQDVMTIQSELLKANLQHTVDSTRKLSELSVRVTNEATQTMARRMEATQRRAA
jgi:hypothetical protein